ncbi:MAG TPA: potassium-transporting ATPase subunit KdpC [Armatimonadota bacterium]|jgi:K+-transporting ATPase ATPase C chain
MLKQLRPAVISVLVFAVLTGLLFPALITGIAQAAFRRQAEGSLVRRNGVVVGSTLIGQDFRGAGYFHPRPSAAGSGYDPMASSGTNLGPTNPKLIEGVRKAADAYRKENGLPADTPLPADAVTSSASGLDPDISPANAALQVRRVAKARDMSEAEVRALLARRTQGRTLGLLGEPRVNVLDINLQLDAGAPRG